ncbi:MAG: hypothetical protein RTU30_09985 [Candidatus Thorarchaeota archaeon]
MRDRKRDLMKILFLVPLSVIAAIAAISGAGIVSLTPSTRVGVHTLLTSWAIIPAAVSILTLLKRFTTSQAVFCSAFLFPMLLHAESAITHLYKIEQSMIQLTPWDTASAMLEITIIAALLAGAIKLSHTSEENLSQTKKRCIVLISFVLPASFHAIMWYIVFPLMPVSYLPIYLSVIGIVSFIALSYVVLLSTRLKYDFLPIDTGYLTAGALILGMSSVFLISSMLGVSNAWIYAETILMAGLLVFGISVGVPFLKKSGFRRRTAYVLVIGLILITYLPLLITTTIESMGLNVIVEESNLLAYSIIHIGAGSLSAMMAILLYIYSRRNISEIHYPMILLFGLWTGVAGISVLEFLFPSFTPLGEPIIPYVVGSFITLALLLYILLRVSFTEKYEPVANDHILLLCGSIGLTALVVIGEAGNQIALTLFPELDKDLLSNTLLLSTNLLIMFSFVYLVFLLSEIWVGQITLEIYVAYFLSMWIIPNILKSYYLTYTAGWWVSELLMFIELLVGPAILAWFYVKMMREAEESQTKANLYADLLMHDVSNYNQMTMIALELLTQDTTQSEGRERLARDARLAVSLSEQLIGNVRLLTETERFRLQPLEPMNLVSVIVSALDEVSDRFGNEQIRVNFQSDQSHAYVMGNELLVYIFMNLLRSALEHITEERDLILELNSSNDEIEFWTARMCFPKGIVVHQEGVPIFNRDVGSIGGSSLGLLVTRLITESLGGYITAMDTKDSNLIPCTEVIVHLPACKDPMI